MKTRKKGLARGVLAGNYWEHEEFLRANNFNRKSHPQINTLDQVSWNTEVILVGGYHTHPVFSYGLFKKTRPREWQA